MPLSFVLFVDMLMKALEDFTATAPTARRTTSRPSRCASPTRRGGRPLVEVRVGDIVRVKNRDVFPADCCCSAGSPTRRASRGVNTKPLDGESDTTREAPRPAAPLLAASDDAQLRCASPPSAQAALREPTTR